MSKEETPRRTDGKKVRKKTPATVQAIYLFYTSEDGQPTAGPEAGVVLPKKTTLPL